MEIPRAISETNWWQIIPAYAALFLSLINFWKGRTSVAINIKEDSANVTISNKSQFPITIVRLGLVEGDGTISLPFDKIAYQDPLSVKIEARSQERIPLSMEQIVYQAFQENKYKKVGIYIETADGKIFTNIGWITRKAWRLIPRINRKLDS